MTTQTNAKVRLVKCPKCKQVLQEPNIPVYRCGGCNTVLEAKNHRKTNTKGKGLNRDGSDANGNGEVESVLDEREINGRNQEGTISAREESLPDSGSNRNQGNCLNQETTIYERGEPLPDAGSSGNQGDCLNQETTISERGEPLPEAGRSGNQDNCLNQEISARGECLPDAGSNRNQDSCLNREISGSGDCLPDTGSNRIEDICLNQETTISSGEESSPDTSNKRSENNSWDYNEKQSGGKIFPTELPSSLELCSHEDEELPAEITEQMEQVRGEYNADQNVQDSENESGDSDRNWISSRSFSDDFFSSMEFPEIEGSSPELLPNMALGENTTTSDHWAKMDKSESENCRGEQHDDNNFLSQVSSPIEEKKHNENDFSSKVGTLADGGENICQNDFSSKGGTLAVGGDDKCLSQHCSGSNECKFEDHRREIPQNANCPNEIPSSTEIVPVIPSSVGDANTEVGEDSGVHSFDNLETEGTLAKEETGSIDADENPLNWRILSDNVDSSDNQHLGAPPRVIPQKFRQRCISDTPDSLRLGNSGSEFGLKHRELSKSPTKCYYGHDGSASSYDDDRIPGRFGKPPRRKVKHSNFKNSNGLHLEDGLRENDFPIENLEMQYQPILGSGLNELLNNESDIRHQARKPLMQPEKNHLTMKYRNKQDDLHDPRSHGRSIGSKMREDREEHISSRPFLPTYPHTYQRKASPPPYPLNTFQHYSGLYSSGAPSYTEPGKMELLRMVNVLKDELNRMQISNRRFPPPVSREEKYSPLYYNHQPAPVGEPSSDLSYSRYLRRYSQEQGLPQLYQPPRMAFSGDAADYRRHVDYPCLHCHPRDWHYSAQLPSHAIHCMGHSGTCYTNPCSTSSSPHRYKSSEFSVWDCDTISVDHRHRDNGMRNLHLREGYQSMKRHVRPVAGGNPIIACYHCSKLLQLPADFLLLGKRCHKLRCNSCGKVMKFSLQSSKHLVPFIPDDIGPPPSMVDDCSESIPQENWGSAAHSNDNPDAEPLSCTDDYGISFERSISTEAEPSVIIPPLHPVGRKLRNRNISSGDSGTILEDRKMKSVLAEHQKMPTKPVENLGTLGPLSKRLKWRKSSSEMKELPSTGGSLLHQLMGYTSPSAVMEK